MLGLYASPANERWHAVRLCIAAIHVVVGSLFLLRRPRIHGCRRNDILACVPAVILSGLAFSHASPCSTWSNFSTSVFVSGTLLTISAFTALARNFAVLPAVRGVTSSGPYRFVRHPAYLGETILVAGCCIAKIDLIAIAIFLATVAAVLIRISTEERVFKSSATASSTEYARYCSQVPHRLLPGIW